MTVELAIGGANLIALIGYFIRTENRLTRLETKIEMLFKLKGLALQDGA